MGSTKVKKSRFNSDVGFSLPDSPVDCSDDNLPIKKELFHHRKAKWHEILEESNARIKEIEDYEKSKTKAIPKAPFQKSAVDYIQNEVFNCLLPALENTLRKAELWKALRHTGCFFNGIDWIVQELWNNNPRHPARKYEQKHVFNIPWIRKYLVKHPRPLYPKSWLWPEEYAAIVIQKSVRQYFVQRVPEVQEMRIFWKKLDFERKNPELIEKNPILAKELATAPISALYVENIRSKSCFALKKPKDQK